MPDIRCPHCGKENPDFLDRCQFCQSPLKSDSMLHIGEKPTKKNTGELENVLPEWLKDARKQSRDSAEEELARVAAQPKTPKETPPDLLAGLSFQSQNADEEEIPDWLLNINPTAKSKPSIPPATPAAEPETDFFAQFNQPQKAPQNEPARPTPPSQPVEHEAPSSSSAAERDELSAWFTQASEQPVEPLGLDQQTPQSHADWGLGEQNVLPSQQEPAPKEEEDLSWLHNLEAASKHTDELKTPKQSLDWGADLNAPSSSTGSDDLSWLNDLGSIPSSEQTSSQPESSQNDVGWLDNLGGTPASTPATPASSGEDLSWLNNLGGTSVEPPSSGPSQPQEDLGWLNAFKETSEPSQPAAAQPSSQEDLSWLNAFGETPQPSQPGPTPSASQEDLSWLDNLGGTPAQQAPSQPAAQPQEDLDWLNAFKGAAPAEPSPNQPASQQDLSWLDNLGATPAEQTSGLSATQDDLSWLNDLQGSSDTLSAAPFAEQGSEEKPPEIPHVSPFTPRQTAPLGGEDNTTIPDWLKSATEGPSMPMGASALDQFREDYKIPSKPEEPFSWKNFMQDVKPEEQPPLPKSEPAFDDLSLFAPAGESPAPSAEDVNSLFSMEMPDWLSQAEPAKEEKPAEEIGIHAEGGEALSPADLPSWVQAMRPVEAALSEVTPGVEDQPAEREGPLAGFKGLIPAVPVGSARRPKPISLKLQTSDEQQSAAAILEQILLGETSPRPLVVAPVIFSQRVLRWVLAGFFIVVLGLVLALRTQIMPISPDLPSDLAAVSQSVELIPDNSNVLVIVDYEPSLAGELEAASGPLLNHVAFRHATLSFVATSPNGPALVERLLSDTNLSRAAPGFSYLNLGYLPGGETGVLSFIQNPRRAMPTLGEQVQGAFSGYSAVVLLTDHAESARVWIEQIQALKGSDATVANQPLMMVASAQVGPLLQPYVSSGQVNGLISGVADAGRYERKNNVALGTIRSYWDAFGIGIAMAVAFIVLGSLWSIVAGIRARRAEAAEG